MVRGITLDVRAIVLLLECCYFKIAMHRMTQTSSSILVLLNFMFISLNIIMKSYQIN